MSKPLRKKHLGLVLTSGGARGAYQAGAIKALAQIQYKEDKKEIPYTVLSGISAGSLNATFLAAQAQDFKSAADQLADLWSHINAQDIFETDTLTLARTSLAWLSDLGLGAWIGTGRSKSLLVTAPLERLIKSKVSFNQIESNLQSGLLRGLAITATNYHTGTTVTFYDGVKEIEPWIRTTHLAVRSKIEQQHVMASSAIPIFFPAVYLDGAYYGDGCVRMNTPLSPSVHLGADKIIAIGVRHQKMITSANELKDPNIKNILSDGYPHLAQVGGVLLNSMFLESLEGDIERMQRINQTLSIIPDEVVKNHPSKLRKIPILALKPSQDLSTLLSEVMQDFSYPIRHLLKGLGASDDNGLDLLSYLAFDSAYTSRLVTLGYEDTLKERQNIIEFLESV